jgi:hypothetical protein
MLVCFVKYCESSLAMHHDNLISNSDLQVQD